MKHLPIFFSLFLIAVATTQDKKISLEDIERDYLNNERKTKTPEVPKSNPKPLTGSPTQYGFVPVKTASSYITQEPKQEYVQIQPQYTLPPQYAIPQSRYQQYENVQYVTDNSITPQTQKEQYYTAPQYIYLHPSSSNAVHTVIDPKTGGLQYIMYVPTYVPQASQQSATYENVVYTTAPQEYQQQPQQYESGIQYVENVKRPEFVPKREPKSLLDSYIPSILQLQYYKQQQQVHPNAIRDPVKVTQSISGKVEYVKGKSQNTADSDVKYVYEYPPTYQNQRN